MPGYLPTPYLLFTSLLLAFQHQAHTRGSSTALIVDNGERFTWSQLATFVDSTACYLQRRIADSTNTPRHLGYLSRNSLDDVVLTLAAAKLGAINVPLNELAGEAHALVLWQRVGGHWIDEAEAKLASSSPAKNLEFPNNAPSSPALILWTSGTSGTPKGVVLSHQSLASNASAKLGAVPQSIEDVRLTCLPLSHAYARTCDFGTWLLSGCTLALTRGFDGWRRLASEVHPTMANVVPSVADRLLEGDPSELGLSRLRVLGVGGAGLSAEAFERWKQRGVVVTQGYGCTETAPVICSATPRDAAAGRVGKPVEGWETQIRNGRLFVRGKHLMLGYWQDADATRKRIDSDGWFDTGDLVNIDQASGQYRILGRDDEVIVLPNGHKVYPASIEAIANSLPDVRHAVLRQERGQLHLWIESENNKPLTERILAALSDRASWEIPKKIHRFETPLSTIDGELTSKGTICRTMIEKHRFG
ncbi:Long-chain-fatty-acid--CoA ligase [Planctomycetes bacterium CA13]|uniref:Long-chain-fatty-acid--CoA ligase n=1 Tax=Novipirellula herctigrandis TaxID=2527986 RepID=A0A5C5Z804_9BACT|nr:Long-chain-fatty-acid--CoA ligase [Planctomycetes bacterium CA13]